MKRDSVSISLSNISAVILPEFHMGLTESLAEVLVSHICDHKISLLEKIPIGSRLAQLHRAFFFSVLPFLARFSSFSQKLFLALSWALERTHSPQIILDTLVLQIFLLLKDFWLPTLGFLLYKRSCLILLMNLALHRVDLQFTLCPFCTTNSPVTNVPSTPGTYKVVLKDTLGTSTPAVPCGWKEAIAGDGCTSCLQVT